MIRKSHLSENMKRIRKEKGLSQEQFAKQVGIAKSTLQNMENGGSPHMSTLEYVAERLGYEVEELTRAPGSEPATLAHKAETTGWYVDFSPEAQDDFARVEREVISFFGKLRDLRKDT